MFKKRTPKLPPKLSAYIRNTAEYERLKYLPNARKARWKAVTLLGAAQLGFDSVLKRKFLSPLTIDLGNKKYPQMRLGEALKIVQDVARQPLMRDAKKILHGYSRESMAIKKKLADLPREHPSLMSLHEREVWERNFGSAKRKLETEKCELEKNTISSLQNSMLDARFDPELLNYSPHEILTAFELMRQDWGRIARSEYAPASKEYEAFWKYFRMSAPTKEKEKRGGLASRLKKRGKERVGRLFRTKS